MIASVFFHSDDPRALLVVVGLSLCAFGFLAHRVSLIWIVFSPATSDIAVVPSALDRKFLGQREISAHLTPESWLLFCRRSDYGSPSGFRIVVRRKSENDVILWNESELTRPSARHWSQIASEIQDLHHVNTKLIEQKLTSSGLEEVEWSASLDRARFRKILPAIIAGLIPIMGGAVRYLTPSPFVIASAGLLLWLASLAIFMAIARRDGATSATNLTTLLTPSFFSFATFYTVSALLAHLAIVRYSLEH
jgi:hypothetical protein